MDSIYTSAELTLIAASGHDPSSGLPGVSDLRKLRYRDATARNTRVSYVPPTVHRTITRSRWFTRGWTFQEGYLPRRRLYFTESAVLFICNQLQEYEGFQRCVSESEVYLLEGTLNPHALGGRSDGSSGPGEVMQLLQQYSARGLSYEDDALNAILGVLNYHQTKDPPVDTLWGIPYQLPPVGQRYICVNWKHHETAVRRPEYPSWSPLGWAGHVKFADVFHQFDLSVKDADNLSDHLRAVYEKGRLLDNSRYLRITVKVYQFPVVHIIRSKLIQTWDWAQSEQERSFLVLAVGSATGNGGHIKLYMHIQWDIAPRQDYDSSQVICAVTHDTSLRYLSIMILQDHGTHYERIGIALANPEPGDTGIIQAAGFDELTSPTVGIQTLRASESPDFYWRDLKGTLEEQLAWIRDIRPVAITLG
jgi:hypothetical protein